MLRWLRVVLPVGLAIASMATIVTAQPRPDFSGTWVVAGVVGGGGDDRDRSREDGPGGRGFGGGFGGMGRGGQRGGGFGPGGRGGGGRAGRGGGLPAQLHVGERLHITVSDALLTIATDQANGGRVTRYPLDGREGVTSAPDGGVTKTKTRWEGVTLVTDSRGNEGGGKAREVRSLSADGLTMTIDTSLDSPGGKRALTATLQRVEDP